VAGALSGLYFVGIRPARPRRGLTWWRTEAWPLGRWLGAEATLYSLSSQAAVFVLAALLGPKALGGLRAVQTIFAPSSLLLPAISLPFLPVLSRLYGTEPGRARLLATKLSAGMFAVTMAYLGALAVGGGHILAKVFGGDFSAFSYLILPVGLQQALAAVGSGFTLLLKASQRGKAFLLAGGSVPILGLIIVSGAAWAAGLRGAAWGYVATSVIAVVFVTVLAMEWPRRMPFSPHRPIDGAPSAPR
jgi:O-antigen/teichoic acid export membrane protein